jgi:glycine C-acetyltransferase
LDSRQNYRIIENDKNTFIENELFSLKKNNLYRRIKIFDIEKDSTLKYKDTKVYNFSSNDYLGLSKYKRENGNLNKVKQSNISQCSSRLISGSSSKIKSLELNLSKHRNTQSSLTFANGYMANLGVLSALGDKDTIIFSDELNHASIIDGCRLSSSQVKIFPHNAVSDLEKLLKKSGEKKKIIITEGIFSMDGDFSKLKEISKISKENNCFLIVDDAHGDFVVGNNNLKNFSGTPAFFNISKEVDVHISSLSKGLGCFGGYVSSSKLICEYLINKSRPFIFTSALPDFLCEIANLSLEVVKEGKQQKKLYNNIDLFYKVLEENKLFNIKKVSFSPIIPIIIGDEKKAMDISKKLLKKGFFVQAIRYPTVKKSQARLRISLSSEHKSTQIISFIDTLSKFIKSSN